MKMRNNKHLRIGLPGGVVPPGGRYKMDYKNLVVRGVEQDGNAVRFDVDSDGHKLSIYARPEDETGKTDLQIVYENKDPLVGMPFEEVLDREIYRDTSDFDGLVVALDWWPLRDGGLSPKFQIQERVGRDTRISSFDCDETATTEEEAEQIARYHAAQRLIEMYGEETKVKIQWRKKQQPEQAT